MRAKKTPPLLRRFVIGADAVATKSQHKKPCADCPFGRKALKGWLAGCSPEDWITMVHGEAQIDCHCTTNQQCAGAAIYRANVCKSPRDQTLLMLEPNTTLVFASPSEFTAHHTRS